MSVTEHDCDENQVIKPLGPREACDRCPGFFAHHAWVCEICGDVAQTGGVEHFNAKGQRQAACPSKIRLGAPFQPDPALNETFLAAYSSAGELIGYAAWDHDGTLQMIAVQPHYRRLGIAMRLWEKARGYVPGLRVSPMLTLDGQAWARSLGPAGEAAATEAAGISFPVSVGEWWRDLVTAEYDPVIGAYQYRITRAGITFRVPPAPDGV